MKLYRGKVIKIENDYAIVLSNTGIFHAIEIKGVMGVSQEIMYTDYDFVNIKKPKVRFNYSKLALVASLILIICISYISLSPSNSEVYAIVSIDINPSIDLYVNKDLEVTKIKAHNLEGNSIIQEGYINQPLDKVVSHIVSNAENKNYITNEKNSILVASSVVKTTDTVKSEKINKIVSKAIGDSLDKEINLYTMSVEKDDIRNWEKEDISIGMYQIATKYNKDILKSKYSISELMKEYNKIKEKININEVTLNSTTSKDNDLRNEQTSVYNNIFSRTSNNDNSNKYLYDLIMDTLKHIKKEISERSNDSRSNEINDKEKNLLSNEVKEEVINKTVDGINEVVEETNDGINKILDEAEDIVIEVENFTEEVIEEVEEFREKYDDFESQFNW